MNYLKLAQSLEEYIGKTFNEWVATVEKELASHLETPLMAKLHNNKYVCVCMCVSLCVCGVSLCVYVMSIEEIRRVCI